MPLPPGPGQPGYRTTQAKIDRLRKRLDDITRTREQDVQFVAILKGILDLLADMEAELQK